MVYLCASFVPFLKYKFGYILGSYNLNHDLEWAGLGCWF